MFHDSSHVEGLGFNLCVVPAVLQGDYWRPTMELLSPMAVILEGLPYVLHPS